MTGEALLALCFVMRIIVTMMVIVMKMIESNQPKPLTGETLPALRQEINARLSFSPGFVLAAKIKGFKGEEGRSRKYYCKYWDLKDSTREKTE